MIETKINIQALRQRTANDKELMIELQGLMNIEKDNYLSDLQNALSKQDLNVVSSILHKLKSAVGVLGFDLLAEKISIVEKNALKNVNDFNYAIEINFIFISLNYHLIELENYLKK